MRSGFLSLVTLILVVSAATADDKPAAPQSIRCRVNGLFQPDRIDDLHEAMKLLPEVTLVKVDYQTTEAEFTFDAAKAFPGAKPTQFIEQMDNRLRNVTSGTFGVRALPELPRDKWVMMEIPIFGLDCKGCSFAAYQAVSQIKGVERAIASFKDGLVTVWIDPEATNREALETALTARRVPLKAAE